MLKTLDAEYDIEVIYIRPQKKRNKSVLNYTLQINSIYDHASKDYIFEIRRKKLTIDGNKPRKMVDRIMLELGDTLYPVRLRTSLCLELKNIVNYSSVQNNWLNKAKDILERYPSISMKQFIDNSTEIIGSEQKLLNYLAKEVFVNLYFRDIYTIPENDTYYMSEWNNFPKAGMNRTFLCSQESASENDIVITGKALSIHPSIEGVLLMNYGLDKCNAIRTIKGFVESKIDDKIYKKEITITSANLNSVKITDKPRLSLLID